MCFISYFILLHQPIYCIAFIELGYIALLLFHLYAGICVCGTLFMFESDFQHGSTALILAAQYGHADSARLLIDAGADLDARNEVRYREFLVFHVFLSEIFFLFLIHSPYANV